MATCRTGRRKPKSLRTTRNCSVSRAAAGDNAPSTVDLERRTVRAVISTDTPVPIYDWETDEYVDEVLIPSGFIAPKRMQLRDIHRKYSPLGDPRRVIGRVFDFQIGNREIEATLRFSKATDAEEIWQRVIAGDLDAVSIGATYRLANTINVEKGKSKKIAGVTYTASTERAMRLVVQWAPDETTVVDAGADNRCVIRHRDSVGTPNRRSLNSTSDSEPARDTDDDSIFEGARMAVKAKTKKTTTTARGRQASQAASASTQRSRRAATAARVRSGTKPGKSEDEELEELDDEFEDLDAIETARSAADAATDLDDDDDVVDDSDDDESDSRVVGRRLNRIEKMLAGMETTARRRVEESGANGTDAKAIRDATRAERERVAAIRDLGEGQPERLVSRAIDEGWSAEQFGLKVLARMRAENGKNRTQQSGDGVNRAPAVHAARNGVTIQALQAAVLQKQGIRLDNPAFASEAGRVLLSRNHLGWLVDFNSQLANDGKSDIEETVELGRRFVTDHSARTCERMLEISDRRGVPLDRDEVVSRAFSNPYMPRVWGAILNAGLIEGFAEFEDSTQGWVSEADWADFRLNQPIGLDPIQGLRKHTRGTEAKDIDFTDYGESYSVARYTGKFQLDEQDIIDDIVGANQRLPQEMGRLARRLRPDLIYSIMLTNANLADGTPLFHADRGNLVTSNALSLNGVTAAETAMATRTVASKVGKTMVLNLMAGHIIVPRALRATGKQIVNSTIVVSGNTTPIGNINPHDGEYKLHSDARLDGGVTDPRNDTAVSGSSTSWYMAERSGQHTIQVGYRRGTGRAPTVRVRPLTAPGVFGLGWDIAYDIGAGVITHRGLVKCTA